MAILVSKLQRMDNLAALRTDKLSSLLVGLIKTDLPADPETSLSDLLTEEADYDDYLAKVAQATTLIVDDAGTVKLVSPNLVFTCGGDQVTANTIYGFFVTDGASAPQLLMWEK